MSKKISKIVANGATVTPTVDKSSIAKCGIPAPSPKGSNNVVYSLADNVFENLKAYPLPAQAQAILYSLDNLGGTATKGEIIKDLKNPETSKLSTTQSVERIWTFYHKRLLNDYFKVN